VPLEEVLEPYVDRVNTALDRALEPVEPVDLNRACRHVPAAGGKRLRPILALLASEAVGGEADDAVPFGVAVELVHTFSLIHDDMMDDDERRRGREAVHTAWKDSTAILAGDTLFARAFEVIDEADLPEGTLLDLHRELAQATRVICEGQARDLALEGAAGSEEAYLEMVEGKTARIFEAATRGGALSGGADLGLADDLGTYGLRFGLAFQVRDDLLDVLGSEDDLGKPVASDVRAGKRTVVYLHAEAQANDARREVLDEGFGNPDATDKQIDAVLDVFEETGAIDHAQDLVEDHTEAALDALANLPESQARDRLAEVARWAASREH
jgi:geranylgeranyl diphosphate synthase type I